MDGTAVHPRKIDALKGTARAAMRNAIAHRDGQSYRDTLLSRPGRGTTVRPDKTGKVPSSLTTSAMLPPMAPTAPGLAPMIEHERSLPALGS